MGERTSFFITEIKKITKRTKVICPFRYTAKISKEIEKVVGFKRKNCNPIYSDIDGLILFLCFEG